MYAVVNDQGSAGGQDSAAEVVHAGDVILSRGTARKE
jgi:hypothetical protein